jgi:parallel beta-helix repeat protein
VTFTFTPGLYRMQMITPKSDQKFVGQPGAIMSGAVLLGSWTGQNGLWTASYAREHVPRPNAARGCDTAHPLCAELEDLFIDDVLQQRVGSVAEVRRGTWYYDYRTVYVGSDPTGHRVEMSVVPKAFDGECAACVASNVTIRGLVIEKYATLAQRGAIANVRGAGWTVDSNEIRFNHGIGIKFASRARVTRNYIHHNGQMGYGSVLADSALFEENEVAYNNTAGYAPGWEAGGGKVTGSRWFVGRGNRVHHNHGNGMWSDGDNIYCLYEQNHVHDNDGAGIFQEIGFDCVIRNNDVERNGAIFHPNLGGAGILVANSANVEVYGNTVLDNYNGIAARAQSRGVSERFGTAYTLRNLHVHDNTIRMASGASGIVEDRQDPAVFTADGNRFERNSYTLLGRTPYFAWMDRICSDAEWRSYGQDVSGNFSRR